MTTAGPESETCSWFSGQEQHRSRETQPPGGQDGGIPPFLSLLFFLPFSKNSDLRFKFFKDMDSESTWEEETRTQWVFRGRRHLETECSFLRRVQSYTSYIKLLHNTANGDNITCHNPAQCNDCFDSTPAAVPLCTRHRNRCHDQSCNLSACVRCSLPSFLMVGGSSRPPPLTPLVATSCGEARHIEQLVREALGRAPATKGDI